MARGRARRVAAKNAPDHARAAFARDLVGPGLRLTAETIIATLGIAAIAWLDWFLERCLGHEVRLLGHVQIKAILDAGHLAVLLRWLVGCLRELIALVRTLGLRRFES